MQISSNHIRAALIQIAQKKGRPFYDVIVQRDVINAFRFDQYHPLKSAVMSEKIVLETAMSEHEIRLNIIKEATKPYGMISNLARAAEMKANHLAAIIRGDCNLTDVIWHKVEKAIRLLAEDVEKYKIPYKYKQCGTVTSYKYKKCRCEACVAAFRSHEAMLKAVA